jgi:major membrane immunogen (membrane-anchored lipoprotein)
VEDKLHTELKGKISVKYLGISVLVLSLLLGACVVSLIYMSLQSTSLADCSKPADESPVEDQRSYERTPSSSYQLQSQQEQQNIRDKATVNLKEGEAKVCADTFPK